MRNLISVGVDRCAFVASFWQEKILPLMTPSSIRAHLLFILVRKTVHQFRVLIVVLHSRNNYPLTKVPVGIVELCIVIRFG